MTTPLRLAVVGTGGIARHHLNNLKKIGGSEIAGLCDVELERVNAVAGEFGGRAFTDARRMLDETKPDALLVCTPPFVRLEPIQAACERKIPFFCEKPPAFSLEDARKVQKTVEASGVQHSVGFMYRHKETTDRVKELLHGQTLIAVRSTFVCGAILNADFPAWFKLQDKSGGPMLDQAIHMLDTLRYVVGDIRSVFALGSNRATTRGPTVTVHDTLNLALEFEDGLGGTHNHSWATRPFVCEYQLLMKDGWLRVDLTGANCLTGELRGMKVEFAPKDDCYITEFQRFLQAVRTKDFSAIRSTYADAVQTLAVCVAANKSAETRQPQQVQV